MKLVVIALALVVGCSKGEQAPPQGAAPMPAEEVKRSEDACKAYVERVCACAANVAAVVKQCELTFEARRRPELASQVRALYENYYSVTERSLVELGIDRDEALTRLVFAALDGLVLQQLIFGDARATDASIERLQELLALLARSGS